MHIYIYIYIICTCLYVCFLWDMSNNKKQPCPAGKPSKREKKKEEGNKMATQPSQNEQNLFFHTR